jgi:hypothetical protein
MLMMTEENISEQVCRQLGIEPRSGESLREAVDRINWMIQHDLHGLVAWLYRVDVSEEKMQSALAGNADRNSAEVILQLVLERLQEKARYRSKHDAGSGPGEIPEEDKW